MNKLIRIALIDFQIMLKDRLKLSKHEFVVVNICPTVRFSPTIIQLPGNKNRENGRPGLKFSLMNMTKTEVWGTLES